MKDNKYLHWFIWIGISIIIISIAYPFILRLFTPNMCIECRGMLGDSYGALNAVFSGLAFAGVIITILIQRTELNNQRTELKLQRDEMQLQREEMQLQRQEMIDTRKEFSVNRITNIIYNELERFEKAVEYLEFPIHDKFKPKGIGAISYLEDKKHMVFRDDSDEIKKEKVIKDIYLYSTFGLQIQMFAITAYNAMNVIKATLVKSNLDIQEIQELKELFFRNIGFIQLNVIEDISKKMDLLHELFDTKNPEDMKMLLSLNDSDKDLKRANIFLKSFNEFRNTILTEEKIKYYNDNWNSEFGEYT
ncbi:hypothetical protein LJC06_02455 [Bacteroidales bacterium OttesenSCG-928-I14]|nr:hypothetical protein [Bacteroidales bacterium OttesenSCG-928-I14]